MLLVMEAGGCTAGGDPQVTGSRPHIRITASGKSVRPPVDLHLPSSPPQNTSCPFPILFSPTPLLTRREKLNSHPCPQLVPLRGCVVQKEEHRRGNQRSVRARVSPGRSSDPFDQSLQSLVPSPHRLLEGSHEVTDMDVQYTLRGCANPPEAF